MSARAFAVLPYLRTSESFRMRGLYFHSSKALDTNESLSPEDKGHLKTIFTFFYDAQGEPIEEMIYASIPLDNAKISNEYIIKILEARQLLAYMYTTPESWGGTFLKHEHADTYVVLAKEFPILALETSEGESFEGWAEGYEVWLNYFHLAEYLSPAYAHKIFPVSPGFWLNRGHDVSFSLSRLGHRNWALEELMLADDDDFSQDRVYVAMEWYNRSCSFKAGLDQSIVNLAIAFESLFGLEGNESKTQRLTDALLMLLGNHARIRSWVTQFYDARSRIVHEGYTERQLYYAVNDPKKISEKIPTYGSLASHGRLIFRLCMQAILSTKMRADETGLVATFHHNQERLHNIHAILSDSSSTQERLKKISSEVKHLVEHSFRQENNETLDFEQIVSVGIRLVKLCLDANDVQKTPDIHSHLEKISEHKIDDTDHHLFSQRQAVIFRLESLINTLDDTDSIKDDLGKIDKTDILQVKKDVATIIKKQTLEDELQEKLEALITLIDEVYLEEKLELLSTLENLRTYDKSLGILKQFGDYVRRVKFYHRFDWFAVDWGIEKRRR